MHPRLPPTLLNHLRHKLCVSAPAAESQVVTLKSVAWVSLHLIYIVTFDISLMRLDGLVSEGEFLDITEIKRQQAEDYECITNNGVAPPDQRKVKVTVNCKYPSLCHITAQCYSTMMYYWYTCKSCGCIIMHEFMHLNFVFSGGLCNLTPGADLTWLDFSVTQMYANCWILCPPCFFVVVFSDRPSHDHGHEEHASPFG